MAPVEMGALLSEFRRAINGQTPPRALPVYLMHELPADFGSLSETNVLDFAYARVFAPSAVQDLVERNKDGHLDY